MQYLKKALIICLSALFTISAPTHAGKYAAEFLNIGIGGRALAMGGAFVPVADDVTALYWNPAGLSRLQQRQVMVMHAERFSGLVKSDVAAFSTPMRSYALGLAYFRTGTDDIPYTSKLDLNGRPIIDKYVNDVEQALFLSFAKKSGTKFAFGVSAKLIRQNIGEASATGFGLDVGALYQPFEPLSLGITLQDITGTYVFWENGHKDVKQPYINLGAAYKKSLPFLRSLLIFSVQDNIKLEGDVLESQVSLGSWGNSEFKVGAEVRILGSLAFRAGFAGEQTTAGAGVRVAWLFVDYAFTSYDLGNAHRVSAMVKF